MIRSTADGQKLWRKYRIVNDEMKKDVGYDVKSHTLHLFRILK